MVWTLVVLGSIVLSGYFLFTNLDEYMGETTIVTLENQQVFLPLVIFSGTFAGFFYQMKPCYFQEPSQQFVLLKKNPLF